MIVVTLATLCCVFWLWLVAFFVYRCRIERKRVVSAPKSKGWAAHKADVAALCAEFSSFLKSRHPNQKVSIQRSTIEGSSNRTVQAAYKNAAIRINTSTLTSLIDFKPGLVHVEPGIPQDVLTRMCIANGVVPEVTLEFPGITVGGALAGGGIESSSHRFGSVFDTGNVPDGRRC
jgi:hypothetical protein